MFQHHSDMKTATPVKLIERQIVEGLTERKSITEIAQDIAGILAHTPDTTVQTRVD
jgi:hypothetical protein